MVNTTHTRQSPARKPHLRLATVDGAAWAPSGPAPVPGIDPDGIVAVMAALEEEGGIRTLGDLACALATHPTPVSAIIALADAGLVELDLAAPLDPAMRVRRVR